MTIAPAQDQKRGLSKLGGPLEDGCCNCDEVIEQEEQEVSAVLYVLKTGQSNENVDISCLRNDVIVHLP